MLFYLIKNYMKRRCVILLMAAGSFAASSLNAQVAVKGLIDKKATPETVSLYNNLWKWSKKHILFGHQHATEYGHGWTGDAGRSDVQSVTGSHPAVIGVDFSGLSGRPDTAVESTKKILQKLITDTYNRGGITTVSWHLNNPISPGGFYWKDSVSLPAVKYIIPGGSRHDSYKKILETIAGVANAVRGSDGKLAPMIFRPWHEFDGDWFWWGRGHCTIEEFTALWRFTVSYLRDTLQVHNFIYAFSPDNKFTAEAQYLERYPGDDFVDMLGMDNYGDFGRDGQYDLEAGYKKLKIVADYAAKAKKLAAFTETGLESIPNPTWWTDVLLKTIRRTNLHLCYVLVWRNDSQSPTHFYAPFPGQASAKDFLKFYKSRYTLFEKELKKIRKNR
jgi:mannan endo-1,4-beta-mannosidase